MGGSGWTPSPRPVWVRGRGEGLRGAGSEAAVLAQAVCAQRAVRARIPPVGVAERKCIWPLGLREVPSTGIFSSTLACIPPSPISLTFVACAFRDCLNIDHDWALRKATFIVHFSLPHSRGRAYVGSKDMGVAGIWRRAKEASSVAHDERGRVALPACVWWWRRWRHPAAAARCDNVG